MYPLEYHHQLKVGFHYPPIIISDVQHFFARSVGNSQRLGSVPKSPSLRCHYATCLYSLVFFLSKAYTTCLYCIAHCYVR
jgi:hypothetical protein